MKKNIVIISNYYPPEMGAAANRIKNMAEGLYNFGNKITVICPLPNYPKGRVFKNYRGVFYKKEKVNNIYINRYWIYPSISKNPLVRFLSMISFALTLWFSIFKLIKNKPDLFIIQSPPLFIALSALMLSKVLGVKNILNVSDIWPLSALELGVIKRGKFYSLLEKIEKWNYSLSDKIVGQSDEIIDHVKSIVDKPTSVYRNVPIFKEYSVKERSESIRVVYAGLLGYAQGILNLCKNVNFKELGVELHLYGAGMEEEDIIEYIKKSNDQIFFHGSISAQEIKKCIRKYDVALIPLLNTIKGAVPSKIFEQMQLGMPILYVGEGEASKIIIDNKIGCVSKPSDFEALKNNILYFNKISKIEYIKLSNNCLDIHKREFHLKNQIEIIRKLIS